AVLDLIDGVAVAEQGSVLVGQVEPEAQARRVDPPVADLAQAPDGARRNSPESLTEIRQLSSLVS
ncbi:MAG: hypothetical protein ACRD08_02425, partial [Acidimicrobiales bacterium]